MNAKTRVIRFLPVKWMIERICHEITEAGVENALCEPPEDLATLYLEILRHIRTNLSPMESNLAEMTLKWVVYAMGPLSPKELLSAIHITLGANKLSSDIPTLLTVLKICQNLVVLDERLGVLRLAHYSVKEFLVKQFNSEASNTDMAEICLTVLLTPGAANDSQELALMDYATVNWPEHFRQSGAGSDTLAGLGKELLTPCPAYETWVSRVSDMHEELRPQEAETLAPLLVVSYFQLLDIFDHVLHGTTNLNSTNNLGRTALHLVAQNGNEFALRLLLEQEGVDVDSKDHRGQTPLSLASGNGREEVVQRLLEREGVDVNSRDIGGRTPLSWAAVKGHEQVVQVLLENEEVDPGSKDNEGQTPLSWAVKNGHDEVVQMLHQSSRLRGAPP